MEHDERADELERETDKAQQASDQLEQEIDDVRSDWEAKKSGEGTPGAVDEEAAGPHALDAEDPATGESKGDERQAEVEAAAQEEAESADEEG